MTETKWSYKYDHMELVINATAFKARCLDLMDQIASRKLTRVTITKRGKPVSELRAPENAPPKRSIIGCMADKMPQLTDEEWAEIEHERASLRDYWPDPESMDIAMAKQLGTNH